MDINKLQQHTPALNDSERAILHKFNNILNSINKEHDNEYVIDYIYPLEGDNVCGLITPHNIQIIKKVDTSKTKVGVPLSGAVTRDNLLDSKQLRYKGRFLKGCEEYVKKQILTHGPAKKPKVIASNEDGDPFIPLYNELLKKHEQQDNDYFQDAIRLLGTTAHLHTSAVRAELQKWCHQFGAYYKPKLANVESVDDKDSQILIEVSGYDDE